MASTNQSPEYQRAEKHFLSSKDDNERLIWLEEMIRECPKHKSSEKMLANLKTRYVKLKKKLESIKKAKKGSGKGLKKADMQCVLVGFTNSGKSSLINKLTNANSKTSENKFTTKSPEIGILEHEGTQIQIIDNPSLKGEDFDIGLANGADLVISVINNISDIDEIKNRLPKIKGKFLIVINKIDLLSEKEKRKIFSTLKSKKHNFVLVSCITNEGLEELKEKIFQSFEITRIYLKEPHKEPSEKPLVIKSGATIKDVARKISKDLAKNIKEVHIWGPSSKFPNQRVGLTHKVKDKDIVEFKTK